MHPEIEDKKVIYFLATKKDIANLKIDMSKLDVKIVNLRTELKFHRSDSTYTRYCLLFNTIVKMIKNYLHFHNL